MGRYDSASNKDKEIVARKETVVRKEAEEKAREAVGESVKEAEKSSFLEISEDDFDEDAVDAPMSQEKPIEPVVSFRPKTIDREARVVIMNTTNQEVYYRSKKSGQEWSLISYGQTDTMLVDELINMNNMHPRYLNEPWLIILDGEIKAQEVIDYIGLTDLYKTILSPSDLDNFFRLKPEKMEKVLRLAPSGIKQLIVSKAMEKIVNKTLDSIRKKEIIEEICGVDFDAVI